MSIGSTSCAENWKEKKSAHFIVFYQDAPDRFAEKTLQRAEQLYRETSHTLGITRYQGWTWDERAKIYIYDDADHYQAASGYAWSGGVVLTHSKTISTFPSANGFFDSVLPHEIAHIVFREFVGHQTPIPLWLDEGVAMYHEDGQRWGADQKVRDAITNGAFIPLSQLTYMQVGHGSDPAFIDLIYAESASLVRFLIDHGEVYRFKRLCQELQTQRPFQESLKRAYMKYRSLEHLEKDWLKFLE